MNVNTILREIAITYLFPQGRQFSSVITALSVKLCLRWRSIRFSVPVLAKPASIKTGAAAGTIALLLAVRDVVASFFLEHSTKHIPRKEKKWKHYLVNLLFAQFTWGIWCVIISQLFLDVHSSFFTESVQSVWVGFRVRFNDGDGCDRASIFRDRNCGRSNNTFVTCINNALYWKYFVKYKKKFVGVLVLHTSRRYLRFNPPSAVRVSGRRSLLQSSENESGDDSLLESFSFNNWSWQEGRGLWTTSQFNLFMSFLMSFPAGKCLFGDILIFFSCKHKNIFTTLIIMAI